MTKDEAIKQLTNALNSIEEKLNAAIVVQYGEKFDWSNYSGQTEMPDELMGIGDDLLITALWEAREEANAAIAWVELHLD